MNSYLKRFWFEFDIETAIGLPPGVGIGCGVTTADYDDAVNLLYTKVFKHEKIPPIKKHIENVDIRDLDQVRVIPNMREPIERGVWFPLGYL